MYLPLTYSHKVLGCKIYVNTVNVSGQKKVVLDQFHSTNTSVFPEQTRNLIYDLLQD